MEQILFAFITGLTTGGISCLAVQGGLLSTGIASQAKSLEAQALSKTQYILYFLGAKIAALTVVGTLLGAFGSAFQVSLQTQAVLQIVVGLFMLATVANLLRLHPVFRYVVVQPPKSFFRFLRRFANTQHDVITPIVLGVGTVFIPCGVTQLMMASAISIGNPVQSAALMAAFAIGTTPLFFTLGITTAKLLTHKALVIIPAIVIGYFGITSIDAGMTLLDSPYTIRNYYQAITQSPFSSPVQAAAPIGTNGKQQVFMTVTATQYSTNYTTLKAGIPVQLTVNSTNAQGCIRAFTIPSMKLTKILPETGTDVIEFTPTQAGKLSYSCNMGMYTGEFNVIM